MLFEHEFYRAHHRRALQGTRSPGVSHEVSNVLEPLFVFPHSRRQSDTMVQRAQKEQRGAFRLSTLQRRQTRSRPPSPRSGATSAVPSNAEIRIPGSGAGQDLGDRHKRERSDQSQTLPARLHEPRQRIDNSVFIHRASRASSDDEDAFQAPRDARNAPSRSALAADRSLKYGSPAGTEKHVSAVFGHRGGSSGETTDRESGKKKRVRQNPYGLKEDPLSADARIIRHSWRCLFLVKRHLALYSSARFTMVETRKRNCGALRELSRHMKALRRITTQPLASELTFDELMRKAEQQRSSQDEPDQGDPPEDATPVGSAAASKARPEAAEQLRRLVYIMKVDDLLLLYSPHTGRRHVQRFGGPLDGSPPTRGVRSGSSPPTDGPDGDRAAAPTSPSSEPEGSHPSSTNTFSRAHMPLSADGSDDASGSLTPSMRELLKSLALGTSDKHRTNARQRLEVRMMGHAVRCSRCICCSLLTCLPCFQLNECRLVLLQSYHPPPFPTAHVSDG